MEKPQSVTDVKNVVYGFANLAGIRFSVQVQMVRLYIAVNQHFVGERFWETLFESWPNKHWQDALLHSWDGFVSNIWDDDRTRTEMQVNLLSA